MHRALKLFIAILISALAVAAQAPTPTTAQDFDNKGYDLLRQNRFEEALEAFKTSERLSPTVAETHANLGTVYMVLKKPADAIASFQNAIALKPTEATFHTAICRAWVISKNFEKALLACKEGVRLAPDSPNANAALIDVMRRASGPTPDIQRRLDLALTQFRDAIAIVELAAKYYEDQRDFAYAAELYLRLTQLQPKSAFYYAKLADLYMRLDREVEAVAAAKHALTLEPTNPYAHYFMGKLFLELGQNADAGDSFAKVIASDEEFPTARYYLAVAEERRGRYEAALSAISEAASREPDNFEYQLQLGGVLNSMSRYEDAIAPLRRAVALKPKDLPARAGLGLALFESANYTDGIASLEETDRLYPQNEIISMFLRVARSRQAYVPRIPELIEIVKAEPQNIDVRVRLIELLTFSRRIDDAEPYIQGIWKLSPRDVKPYIKIAVCYSTAGKSEKAMDAYQRGLAIMEDPAIYLGFASHFARRGLVEQASQAYSKILELQANSPGIMHMYAIHLLDNGKRREALEMFKRSLAIKPINGPALFDAAMLSVKLGDLTAAQQYLATLRTVDPGMASKLERCLRLRIWG